MTDETTLSVTDPHHVPVTFVNQVVGTGFLNGVCNITLSVAQFTPIDGKVQPDLVIASRLRMDLFCAQQLYEQLGQIIDKNMPKPDKPN